MEEIELGFTWCNDELHLIVEKELSNVVEDFLEYEKIPYDFIYQSKYNPYLAWDYEPFSEDSYFLRYRMKSKDKNKLLYARAYLLRKLNRIGHLERCYEIEKESCNIT